MDSLAGAGEADAYRLHARYYRDNVQVTEVTWSPGMSGTAWLNWSGVATLEHGRQYGICVTGEYFFAPARTTSAA